MLTLHLPSLLKPYAKAINAFLSGAILIVLNGLASNSWDVTGLKALLGALLVGVLTFATPNDA